jgi:hypothetical protein
LLANGTVGGKPVFVDSGGRQAGSEFGQYLWRDQDTSVELAHEVITTGQPRQRNELDRCC